MNSQTAMWLEQCEDEQAVEATVFQGDTMLMHVEMGILYKRSKARACPTVEAFQGGVELFIRDSMDAKIYFAPDHRPHILVSVSKFL